MREGIAASTARGFSLIELMVVVAVMAVLASAAIPLHELTLKREKEQELRVALRQIRGALDAYKEAVADGRIARKAEESDYPRKLEDLVKGVPDLKNPEKRQIYFLRRLPRDPMNEDSSLPAAATWGRRASQSPPDDPQEGDDIFDVYSRSPQIGLNGVAYDQW